MKSHVTIIAMSAVFLSSIAAPAAAIRHQKLQRLAFTADGTALVTAGAGKVIVWDLITGQTRATYSYEGEYVWLSPNGEAFAWRTAAYGTPTQVHVHNWKRNVTRSWPASSVHVYEIVGRFSSDARFLALEVTDSDYDREFGWYDSTSGATAAIRRKGQGDSLLGLTDQGELVLSEQGNVVALEARAGAKRALGQIPSEVARNRFRLGASSYSRDFRLALLRPYDNLLLWSLPESRIVRDLGAVSALSRYVIDGSGASLAVHDPVAYPSVVRFIEATGREQAVPGQVGQPAFSADGQLVALPLEADEIGVLEFGTGVDFVRTRAERSSRIAESLGVTTRHGFKTGKIGDRMVPRIENGYYETEVLFRLGEQEALRTTGTTYASGGGSEDVRGYHAIFGVANQSPKHYVVDLVMEWTATHSQWRKYETFLTGRQSRQLETNGARVQTVKSFLLKAGEQIKDQIAVGETEPSDFAIFVARLAEVDAQWIANLDRALAAQPVSEAAAREVLPVLEELAADDRAGGWREILAARVTKAKGIIAAAELQRTRELFDATVVARPDYDPDFLNDVVVRVQSRAAVAHVVVVRCPGGREEKVNVAPGSSETPTVRVQNVPKSVLTAQVISVVPLAAP